MTKSSGGPTAIEYGLIAALIGVVIITAIASIDDWLPGLHQLFANG